ncbi:putative MFS-type transporter YcaD [Paraliobacillus sp. PM-2]|uniref:MFS transporter n=1 Tax=Paraliobacillus sp. PM-2 TaxID=1462524 RepID=UPI00061BFBEE|nr:MFS transporter [Paraliobacillus sp. PM-2]CQR47275.1 putative MFS-type transporter YcaD [Paraliobacillus sp. PM-2]
MFSEKVRFWVLISFVTVSGFSQGMLLPLLAIILEQMGVPSSVNGLHATGLYIGVLIASPFMEKPLQKLGYKPIILIGGFLVLGSLFVFPIWQALWFWFILRLLIGIGDHMLHFATQTWITSTAAPEKRGKIIAFYGLFFSLGFSIGPLMTRLLVIHQSLPFVVSAIFCLVIWLLMLFIRNEYVNTNDGVEMVEVSSSIGRFIKTGKLAWVALLAPFVYGLLESTLHGIFPVYGLRIGHDVDILSVVIPLFSFASLLTQIPLGILSDKIGRKKMLLAIISLGIGIFVIGAQIEHSIIGLFFTFAFAGMLLGSLYSLGVSFMADLLPKTLLPAGNIMCGIAFSIGSITGPYLGGLFIDLFPNISFFYVIVILLVLVVVAIGAKKETGDTMTA